MRTMEVLTLKVALVAPAGTITLEGTLAALLLLESATCAPPAGAGPLSVTVPVEGVPPITPVGLSVSEESVGRGGGVTVRVMVVVRVKVPDVPVMVAVTVPTVAALLAASVIVLVVVAGLGLNDAVTPLGRPAADKLTLPLKPFSGVTVMVATPAAPCTIVKPLGEAEMEKFGDGGTALVTDTLSKLAVASEEVLRLLAASPTYTFCAMVTVWLAPSGAQFRPSREPYRVNTFPLLASFIQYGRAALPKY